MRLLHIFLLAISATACMAEPSKTTSLVVDDSDCTEIRSSYQIDDCIHKEMMNSNVLLSNALISVEKRVEQAYAADLQLGQELIEIVREAQYAWLGFRDKDCKIQAFEIEKDTPAYVTTINNCVIQMNDNRIEELKNMLR